MKKNCKIVQLYDLRIDGLAPTMMSRLAPGIVTGSAAPTFSWKINCGIQRACRIIVASTPEQLQTAPDLWDSFWIRTRDSLAIRYEGKRLHSCNHLFFKVFVEMEDGETAESEIGEFTVGLLSSSDWTAKWITADGFEHIAPAPAPYFRRCFEVRLGMKQALLFSSARGLLELTLNGKRIDEHDFLPGWSHFPREIQYTAYDVTGFIRPGDNLLGAILGDGWYIASFPGYRRSIYGSCPSMILQLEIFYNDGTSESIVSDSEWRWNYGPILSSDIFDGENYNALRIEQKWLFCDFDDSHWKKALVRPEDNVDVPTLVRKLIPGACCNQLLDPVAKHEIADGIWIYDFGQIITGRVRLHFTATEMAMGLKGRLRYGEVLDANGYLYYANCRSADNVDSYVARIGQNEWEAHFTFRGFRYVQLEVFSIAGYGLRDIELKAVVLNSDLDYTGDFACGFEPLNKLAANIRNSMRGNLLEIPMDCTQRDERMGWSGDAHLFFPTAMFLADGRNFYRKYLSDLRMAQREDGAICSVAPAVPCFQFGSPGWADALPRITWELYRRSGDIQLLVENYDAVKRYFNYQKSIAKDLILTGHPDHLSLAEQPVDCDLIGTVFFKHSAQIAANMASILGYADDTAVFRELECKINLAFRKRFLDAEGVLINKSQSGFALLFYFDMFASPSEKIRNAKFFQQLIRQNGNHPDTGFIGTAYLCPALAKAGLSECACDLLLQKEYPSWLFEVEHGATTIWERWDSYHPAKGFAPPLMNSFNHCANGAIGEFLFAYLAGCSFLATDEEGKLDPHICFNIVPDQRIGYAKTTVETPCGKASCEWKLEDGRILWHCTVPPNAYGYLDGYGIEYLEPGEHKFVFDTNTGLSIMEFQCATSAEPAEPLETLVLRCN